MDGRPYKVVHNWCGLFVGLGRAIIWQDSADIGMMAMHAMLEQNGLTADVVSALVKP